MKHIHCLLSQGRLCDKCDKQFSKASTRCPVIQFNSDILPGVTPDPTSQGLSPKDWLTSDASSTSGFSLY